MKNFLISVFATFILSLLPSTTKKETVKPGRINIEVIIPAEQSGTLIIPAEQMATLDTVYIRNLQLKYEEYCWIKGNWSPTDLVGKKFLKKLKAIIALLGQNPADNTLATCDSVPGPIGVIWFYKYQSTGKGETSYMSNDANSIATKIHNYTPILTYTNPIDSAFKNNFKNSKSNGKDDYDN